MIGQHFVEVDTMERVFNNRFAQIMELLQQQGLSLSMSSKSGFRDIERNGQYICQISEERLIWDDRVNANETVQEDFGKVLQVLESV